MTISQVVVASTNPVRGITYSRKQLEDYAEGIDGERAIRHTLDHNLYYVPLGKIRDAMIVEAEHGPTLIATSDETHEISEFKLDMEATEKFYKLTFVNDRRPFKINTAFTDDFTTIAEVGNLDPAEYTTLVQEAKKEGIAVKLKDSRAEGFQEIIQFFINNAELAACTASGWLLAKAEEFTKKTIDNVLSDVAETVAKRIGSKLRKGMKLHEATGRGKENNGSRICITINATSITPEINLLQDKEITEIDVKDLFFNLAKHMDLIKESESVTFTRNGKEEWKLLHCLNSDGSVIVSEECYKNSVARKTEIENTPGWGTSLGSYAEEAKIPVSEKKNIIAVNLNQPFAVRFLLERCNEGEISYHETSGSILGVSQGQCLMEFDSWPSPRDGVTIGLELCFPIEDPDDNPTHPR